MMWTALAIDPGPTRSGVAAVSFDGRRFQLRRGQHLRFGGGLVIAGVHDPLVGADQVDFLLDDAAEAGAIVAIEWLVGFAYEAKRVQQLVETSGIQSRFLERAIQRKIVVRAMTAHEWRGQLCRCGFASDDQVRIMVEGMIPEIQRFPREERPHIYDAAGLAIVEICRAARIQIPRSSALERALLEQQAADKGAMAAKRAAKKAGTLPPDKRGLTRGQRARRSAGTKRGWAARKAGL